MEAVLEAAEIVESEMKEAAGKAEVNTTATNYGLSDLPDRP